MRRCSCGSFDSEKLEGENVFLQYTNGADIRKYCFYECESCGLLLMFKEVRNK